MSKVMTKISTKKGYAIKTYPKTVHFFVLKGYFLINFLTVINLEP